MPPIVRLPVIRVQFLVVNYGSMLLNTHSPPNIQLRRCFSRSPLSKNTLTQLRLSSTYLRFERTKLEPVKRSLSHLFWHLNLSSWNVIISSPRITNTKHPTKITKVSTQQHLHFVIRLPAKFARSKRRQVFHHSGANVRSNPNGASKMTAPPPLRPAPRRSPTESGTSPIDVDVARVPDSARKKSSENLVTGSKNARKTAARS